MISSREKPGLVTFSRTDVPHCARSGPPCKTLSPFVVSIM